VSKVSEHSTQFEATPGGLALTNAILLYRSEAHESHADYAPAFASIHAIEHRDGRPEIAAGTPLSRGHLRDWTKVLNSAAAPEILPDNILVSHPDMLAWWVPEQVRAAYFALSSPPAGMLALSSRTVVSLPYPAHLFIATRSGLGVYALPESVRPTAATTVLHSPVLNVYINGSLCWGNIPRPKALTIASIPEFERAVFDSWSTHPNPGQENTVSGKGGLVRLWDHLAARAETRFPVARLKAFDPRAQRVGEFQPITLGHLISKGVR
jgi:PRTRC genetic system protein B